MPGFAPALLAGLVPGAGSVHQRVGGNVVVCGGLVVTEGGFVFLFLYWVGMTGMPMLLLRGALRCEEGPLSLGAGAAPLWGAGRPWEGTVGLIRRAFSGLLLLMSSGCGLLIQVFVVDLFRGPVAQR